VGILATVRRPRRRVQVRSDHAERRSLDPVHWIVDGMNVIGTRPDGWWRDRDAAMARLVRELEDYAAESGEDITVVFERNPGIRSSLIEVAWAPKAGPDAADFEIARRVEQLSDRATIVVATSDRWLADRVSALGVAVVGAQSFRDRLA
jgi:predicted RNA-binding protein with PIN domain